jgi:hypothetical protein
LLTLLLLATLDLALVHAVAGTQGCCRFFCCCLPYCCLRHCIMNVEKKTSLLMLVLPLPMPEKSSCHWSDTFYIPPYQKTLSGIGDCNESIIYSSRILCLSYVLSYSCRPVILSSCHICGTLSYSLCFSNQTDQGDKTEGLEREGLRWRDRRWKD